jgi:tetratricopeptide (TPR) repeat protein
MRVWLSALVLTASCATRPGGADETRTAPSAPPPSTTVASATFTPSANASLFQASYDDEAVARNDAALAALDRLPADQQGSYLVHLRRGWLLAKLGRSADAIAEYGKATLVEPTSVEARLGALPLLAAMRRWSDVETTSREVLERDPASYTATLRLAFALYSLGRFAEAEVVYRRLLVLYPGDVEVKAGVGWSLQKQGKTVEARRVFSAVLDVAPKNALALDGMRVARPAP